MTCKCEKEIGAKVLENFIKSVPEGTQHKVIVTGYGLTTKKVMVEGVEKVEWISRGCMPVELKHEYKTKGGVSKIKKETTTLFFTYCPFCGEKY